VFAVAAQVVAGLQRNRARVALHASFENRRERSVNRGARAVQIGGEVGVGHVELVVLVEVVTAFRHGERDDLARGIGALDDQRIQIRRPRHHAFDRANRLVGALALRRDGFQRVDAVLRSQRFGDGVHVAADVADDERPVGIAGLARFIEPMQIPGLMRAME